MALLTQKAPVDYQAQQGMTVLKASMLPLCSLTQLIVAFEDFLLNYKSTTTELDALEDLNLEGDDDTSDEYDFMDDVAGGKEARQANAQSRAPKRKYMDMLQDVSDRRLDQVTVELDDLDNVWRSILALKPMLIVSSSTKKATGKRAVASGLSNQLSKMQNITSTSCRPQWTRLCRGRPEKSTSRTM